jgi:hypothetical protein
VIASVQRPIQAFSFHLSAIEAYWLIVAELPRKSMQLVPLRLATKLGSDFKNRS